MLVRLLPVARPAQFQCRTIRTSATVNRAHSFGLNPRSASTTDFDNEHSGHYLRMLMFGKPGAGKGTLSSRLVKKYDILSLSTGDLLRQHIQERTKIGRIAEEVVASGKLLPDELMLEVVGSKLDALKDKHWILDGFPRTLGQGQLLDAHLKKQSMPLTLVVNLDVPDQVILGRISDRWVHLPSGRVYNISYNRPKVDGLDDVTGEPLTKRPDDNPEIFSRRLVAFYESTSPLLAYYKSSSSITAERDPHLHPHQLTFHRPHKLKVATISGTTSDEIWPLLDQVVKATIPDLKERTDSARSRRHSLSDAVVAEQLSEHGADLK
ncbi:adenylate kinase-domain-containing protein [Cyathus striatus]|nr:adenylate kinase-domain-containing protein [Cyathus striatus]